MKKYILFTLLTLFVAVSHGQVDRSKQPKPGPAPEIHLKQPERFTLSNGLTVLLVENHKLPRVRIQLTLDNPPVLQGDKAGVSDLTSSMLGKGSKNISMDDFYEEVDFLGANISLDAQSGFASSLSKYFPRILELMADAALNPNFTQEEFDKEKDKLITGLKSQEKDVSAISNRVQAALAYGKGHPFGEITSEKTVNSVALEDVEQYYRSYFVPENAYLVVIGDVDPDQAKELVTKYFTPWVRNKPPSFSYAEPQDAQYTQINFIDMPNAVQSEIGVENITKLRMKDPDYLPALLANRILGGGSQGRLFKNLREDKGYTYGSYSQIRDNKFSPMRFNAYAQVRNAVTDSAVVQILGELDKITGQKVSEEELATAKAQYAGSFVMALERPETVANYALNIETEGLSEDFYKTYLERIHAITVEDVQKAAQKFFSTSQARIVVTGKGSDVLENLEKVSFKGKAVPVLFYDTNAEKAERAEYNLALPEGIDRATVLQKYFGAIGGKDKIEGVKAYALTAQASIQGMTMELLMKKTDKNQFFQDLLVMGNSMQKQVLDGNSGYKVIQGQRSELTPEEIEMMLQETAPFPELGYLMAENVSLVGMEPIHGKNAYKLQVGENKTVFYDAQTGLKIQEVTQRDIQGQQFSITMDYGDYREVSGIMFPFSFVQQVGPQTFEFTVTELKVNEGVDASDFK